jgi:hypothetical protein
LEPSGTNVLSESELHPDRSGPYDRAVYITATENQDIAIIETAYAIYNQDYNVGLNQDLASESLAAGGIATIVILFRD